MVIRVELVGIGHVEEALGVDLADDGQLVDGLVSEHVEGLQVGSAVDKGVNSIEAGRKAAETTISTTSSGTVDDATREIAADGIDGIAEPASREVAVLEVGGGWEPVLNVDLVVKPVMGVGKGHVTVVKSGIWVVDGATDGRVGYGRSGDGGRVNGDSSEEVIRRQSSFGIGRSADILQGGCLGNGASRCESSGGHGR